MVTIITEPRVRPALEETLWWLRQAKAPRIRTMREFAEAEIRLHTGPHPGRFRCERQPFTGLFFDAVDSGRWSRIAVTGPRQSSKTVSGFAIPTMYHLFETQETVVCGLPNADLADDKWREDFEPIIAGTRYRELIPLKGGGSRGGRVKAAVTFAHGVTLRFMTGGGADKSRAGFTARVVVVTETDGMDKPGRGSREADKISQIEACSNAFGARARTFLECTVSIETGRIWQEYTKGTASKIALPCPHCGHWVTPEREHLVGWREAEDILTAREKSAFVCPDCGALWSEPDRAKANAGGKLVHAGQEITPEGQIVGEPRRTDTLGFRWTAVNNLLRTAGDIGAEEWKGSRSADPDNDEKKLRQYNWAIPAESPELDLSGLAYTAIVQRAVELPRGVVPDWAELVTAGIDVGKWLLHWTVIAWGASARAHVVDYGRVEVPSKELGEVRGIVVALREFKTRHADPGWERQGGGGSGGGARAKLAEGWIDSRYNPPPVLAFCKEAGELYRPALGFGATQPGSQPYRAQRQPDKIVAKVGEGYHLVRDRKHGLKAAHVDSDHWKSFVHDRLGTPTHESGAMTLFAGKPTDHLSFARHLTAEERITEFVAGRGNVIRWRQVNQNNHFLDSTMLASAAGHSAGVRLMEAIEREAQEPAKWFSARKRRRGG